MAINNFENKKNENNIVKSELELLVDSNLWPVPSYGELLFK